MTIFLDESAPRALTFRLPGHEVQSVASMHWRGMQNGNLLRLVNAARFDVFITADKNMIHEQDMTQYTFATLVLSTNDWKVVRDRVQAIREALIGLKPATVSHVDCGVFVPGRRRK